MSALWTHIQEEPMRRLALAVLSLAFLAACQPATTELTEEQKAEIAAEVNVRLDAVWDELKQPDFDRLATFFHRTPGALSVSNGRFIEWSPARDSINRAALAEWEDQVLTISETRTVVLSPDVVYTMRVGTDSITYRSGEVIPTRPWAWTCLWVLRDGEWRIMYVHGSHPSPLNQ
jgi:hypothetical protein